MYQTTSTTLYILHAYQCRIRVLLPCEDPGELVAQLEDLHARVDDGVGLVVGLQHPVVAEAVGVPGGAAALLRGRITFCPT